MGRFLYAVRNVEKGEMCWLGVGEGKDKEFVIKVSAFPLVGEKFLFASTGYDGHRHSPRSF